MLLIKWPVTPKSVNYAWRYAMHSLVQCIDHYRATGQTQAGPLVKAGKLQEASDMT